MFHKVTLLEKNKYGVSHPRYREIITKLSSKRLIMVVATTILCIIVTLGISLSIQTEEPVENNTIVSTYPPIPGKYRIYTKSEWGGRPSLNFTKPLIHPTEYVVISHTASSFCQTVSKCSAKMQQMQSQHVSELRPDIGYNFVIGGDAGIYVGRGWDVKNFHNIPSIGISFIGNFVYDYLTVDMIEALKELLNLGIRLGKLSDNYRLIGHNQTRPILSPGEHVYMEISKFYHFFNGTV